MAKETVDRVVQKIIEISFYALFFITPLLMNQANSEIFELPKMFFVWAITIIITGFWLIRMIVSGRILFQRTFLDIPLLIFLIAQFLSFFFSIDRHTSFWGYYSRFNGGLASILSYALLYWAFVSNMGTRNTLHAIRFLLISGLVVVLWGIPAHFGYDLTCFVFGYGLNNQCWTEQFVPTARIFSTLGQPNWLAAWLVALMPISWALALNATRDTRHGSRKKILILTGYVLLVTVLLLALIYTRSQSGFIGLLVALTVFSVGVLVTFGKQNIPRSWAVLSILAVVGISVIIILFKTPTFFQSFNTCLSILFASSPTTQQPNSQISQKITPSSDIRCIVWKGAVDIWKNYPILGTGPETFAYSYYAFRPAQHNLTSEWDLLYNKAHNEYLNMAANTGVVGLGSYLILIIVIIRQFIINNLQFTKEKNYTLYILNSSLLAGFASILITNFFGFSVVPVQLQFFLYPAMAIIIATRNTLRETRYSPLRVTSYMLPITISIVLLVTCYVLLRLAQYYLADVRYAQAERLTNQDQYLAALPLIRRALEIRSGEPLYQNELANILSSLVILTKTSEIESADQTTTELNRLAVEASDKALEISPRNLNFLRTRVTMFVRLATLDPTYFSEAFQTLEKASKLAPTEPKIAYNLGFLYLQTGEIDQAITYLSRATALRPLYRDAWFALALAKWEAGEKRPAREALSYILKNIAGDDQEVLDKLKGWERK